MNNLNDWFSLLSILLTLTSGIFIYFAKIVKIEIELKNLKERVDSLNEISKSINEINLSIKEVHGEIKTINKDIEFLKMKKS